ncbi:MAG: STAS domain-containing protein [Gemmatimonadota bacterium]
MRGHGGDERTPGLALVHAAAMTSEEEARRDRCETDLIFDFSQTDTLDVKSLSWLLTAQRMANQNDQTVWLTGLPSRVWALFRAMGLDEYFRVFPDGEAALD